MLSAHMLPAWSDFGVGLANHIWQSTVFMIAVGALTLLFRRNSAVVRYRLWLIASAKFLIPFSFLIGIGGQLNWHAVQQFVPTGVPVVVRQISLPFSVPPAMQSALSAPTAPAVADPTLAVIFASVWFAGAVSVLLMWCARWLQVARIVRGAKPLPDAHPWNQFLGKFPRVRILSSPAGLEPGVFGVFRPVLLMPADIAQHLHSAQWEPIIAHEMFHVRGCDNLAAAMHTIVEAVFWFHPLVWWLGNRLVDERERACDEAVLKLGCEPAEYAEGILKICKRYVVAPACVAGVSGSNLKKRIEAIMENRETRSLTLGKKLMLTLAGIGVFAGPLLSGVAGTPPATEVQIVSVLAPSLPVYETAPKAAAAAIAQPPAPPAVQTVDGQQKSLDDVSMIITDEERKAFQQLTKDEERNSFIMNFWLVRDPTPGTPANEFRDEYNNRVAYANEHFATRSGIRGSQTDRGRMYILNGPPNEIVVHIGGTFSGTGQGNNFVVATETTPFETWRYRHIGGKGDNLVYEFVDKQRNGEYTLEYDPAVNLK